MPDHNFFETVKSLMETGLPKYKACDKAGICRNKFNKILTKSQKVELAEISAMNWASKYQSNKLPYAENDFEQ